MTYTSADGRLITAELRGVDLGLGGNQSWQLAWTDACPVSGGAWRRAASS